MKSNSAGWMAAVCGLAVLATGAAAAAAPGAWTKTATQGISLSQLTSALDLGPVPAGQALTVRVGLAVQNRAALDAFLQHVTTKGDPLYGQYLTPAQFTASYGATAAQVNLVTNYLAGAGFSNIVVEPNNLMISATGTAGQAESAFNTQLEQFSQFGSTVFGNTMPARVPVALGGVVTGVLGLNSIGKMKPTLKKADTTLPTYLASYTPVQFQQIYGAGTPTDPLVIPGKRTSIAIMAEGDMTGVVSDLRIAEAAFGLQQVPLTVVQVGLPSSDVAGADEWDMDTQYSTGLAGNVKMLYLYTTTSLSDSDLALEFSRWVTDDLAQAASASLGECEVFPYIDGSMAIDDMIFLEAAAQGQTFFASSGDTGSFCPAGPAAANGVPAGAPFVSYPAASPYVIGVGGTSLLTNADGSYNSEISWYSGGGGLSQFESAPFWQQAASTVVKTAAERAVPDIAYDADPNSGALVYVNGVAEGVGGTSLSSPMALGTWARALTANPTNGFAGPRLYSLYNGTGVVGAYPNGGFHDVQLGTNGLYPATPGFDLDTGLGTPQIQQLVQGLKH